MSSREQLGRRLDKQPNTEGRLSGLRKMTQPGEIFLMMEASEGFLYCLAELRAAKPRLSKVNTSCVACPADLQL